MLLLFCLSASSDHGERATAVLEDEGKEDDQVGVEPAVVNHDPGQPSWLEDESSDSDGGTTTARDEHQDEVELREAMQNESSASLSILSSLFGSNSEAANGRDSETQPPQVARSILNSRTDLDEVVTFVWIACDASTRSRHKLIDGCAL